MNVFDFAIQMEEDGRKLYRRLAADTDEEELKTIFTLLAEEEERHRDIFEAMKSGLDPATAESRLSAGAGNAFRRLLERKDTLAILRKDPDGYRHSIRAEEDYIRVYEEMAKKEKDERKADLLRRIATEERRHLSIMENIYDFVESPATYLAWGEFSNLKEF